MTTVNKSEPKDPAISFARVLERLRTNPELIRGTLRRGDSFCVIGMLADESGIGEWVYSDSMGAYEYCYPGSGRALDYEDIMGWYGLDMRVDMFALPESLQEKLVALYGLNSRYALQYDSEVPLWKINDRVNTKEKSDTRSSILCEVLEYMRLNSKSKKEQN